MFIELFVVERIGASEFGMTLQLSHEQKQHEVYADRLLSVKVLYCRYVQEQIISIEGADVFLLLFQHRRFSTQHARHHDMVQVLAGFSLLKVRTRQGGFSFNPLKPKAGEVKWLLFGGTAYHCRSIF